MKCSWITVLYGSNGFRLKPIRRNVHILSMVCRVCGMEEETLEHSFSSCEVAARVWDFISHWCRIDRFFFFSVRDLPIIAQQLRGDAGWKQTVHLIIATSIWCIWRNRNDAVFNSIRRFADSVIDEVRLLSFIWIKNRSRYKTLSWENWCEFNFNCFR